MIYALKDIRASAVKIGYSAGEPGLSGGLKRRFSQLQQGNPYPLWLVALAPGPNRRFERYYHLAFDQWSMRGEWFQLTGPVAEFVRNWEITPIRNAYPWPNVEYIGKRIPESIDVEWMVDVLKTPPGARRFGAALSRAKKISDDDVWCERVARMVVQ